MKKCLVPANRLKEHEVVWVKQTTSASSPAPRSRPNAKPEPGALARENDRNGDGNRVYRSQITLRTSTTKWMIIRTITAQR